MSILHVQVRLASSVNISLLEVIEWPRLEIWNVVSNIFCWICRVDLDTLIFGLSFGWCTMKYLTTRGHSLTSGQIDILHEALYKNGPVPYNFFPKLDIETIFSPPKFAMQTAQCQFDPRSNGGLQRSGLTLCTIYMIIRISEHQKQCGCGKSDREYLEGNCSTLEITIF